MEIIVSVQGQQQINRRFRRFEQRLMSSREPLLEIAELIAKGNEKSWGSGPPLAPSTVAEKQRLGLPAEKMVRTGATKQQMTTMKGVRFVSDHELLFGTDRFDARMSQYGTKHQPKRRELKFGPATRTAATELLMKHLTGGL